MFRTDRSVRLIVPVLTFLVVVCPGFVSADSAPVGPVLTSASGRADSPGEIRVSGEGFTPAGLVYVALYDRPSASPDELRLAPDTLTDYGMNGSVDPAAEPGGRAFGAALGFSIVATPAIFGPNGSADPALGYVRGGTIDSLFRIPCGVPMAVQALDRTTGHWSTWVVADPDC